MTKRSRAPTQPVEVEVEFTNQEFAAIEAAAKIEGVSVESFILAATRARVTR